MTDRLRGKGELLYGNSEAYRCGSTERISVQSLLFSARRFKVSARSFNMIIEMLGYLFL